MSGVLCLKWNTHSSTFLKKLSSLRSKELSCDVTLVCHGKFFPVHSLILSTCSEYFENIFERTKCKHPFIILKDIEPIELEALLNYMYEGEINVLQDKLPALIKAAEDLKIKGLSEPSSTPPPSSPHKELEDHHIKVGTSKKINKKSSKTNSELPDKEIKKEIQNEFSEFVQENVTSNFSQSEIYINDRMTVKKECNDVENSEVHLNDNNQNSLYNDKADTQKEHLLAHSYSSDANHAMDQDSIWMNDVSFENNENNLSFSKVDFRKSKVAGIRVTHESATPSQSEVFSSTSLEIDNQLDFPFPSTSSSVYDESILRNSILKQISKKKSCSTNLGKSIRVCKESNDGPFCCTLCPFQCSKKSYLRLHFRMHTGERLYKCHLCTYSTAYKTNFKNHILTHTGEKPFKCPKCPFRTTRKAYVISHLRTHNTENRKMVYS